MFTARGWDTYVASPKVSIGRKNYNTIYIELSSKDKTIDIYGL